MLTNNALHETYLTLARHHVAIYPDQGALHLPEAERSWSSQEYRSEDKGKAQWKRKGDALLAERMKG